MNAKSTKGTGPIVDHISVAMRNDAVFRADYPTNITFDTFGVNL